MLILALARPNLFNWEMATFPEGFMVAGKESFNLLLMSTRPDIMTKASQTQRNRKSVRQFCNDYLIDLKKIDERRVWYQLLYKHYFAQNHHNTTYLLLLENAYSFLIIRIFTTAETEPSFESSSWNKNLAVLYVNKHTELSDKLT